MSIPGWYELALLALAGWRVFQLISEDDILDTPRRYVTARMSEKQQEFVECPYCAGFWIFALWWASWQVWEFGTMVAASLFAGHALLIGAYKVLASD